MRAVWYNWAYKRGEAFCARSLKLDRIICGHGLVWSVHGAVEIAKKGVFLGDMTMRKMIILLLATACWLLPVAAWANSEPVVSNVSSFAQQQTDTDKDKIDNRSDNCPNVYNPLQKDIDNNGIGDICDPDTAKTIFLKSRRFKPGRGIDKALDISKLPKRPACSYNFIVP